MGIPRCCVCGKSVFQTNEAMARINEKGVPGVWACYSHTDKPKDSVTKAIEEWNFAKANGTTK